MNRERHVPIRTCVACKSKRPKSELIRMVVDATGRVVLDVKGTRPGRGAYICKLTPCMEALGKRKGLSKAFPKKASPAIPTAQPGA